MVDGLLARCSLARLTLCPSISLNRRFQEPQRASECLSGAVFGRARQRALDTDGRAGAGTSTSSGLAALGLGSERGGGRGWRGSTGAGRSSSAKRQCQASVSGARRGGGGDVARGVMGEGEKGGRGRAESREEVKQKGQRQTG